MSISTAQMEEIIVNALPGATAKVTSNDLVHFDAVVIAPQFVGLSLVKRQQMIYELFKQQIASQTIHALSIKTLTPAQGE